MTTKAQKAAAEENQENEVVEPVNTTVKVIGACKVRVNKEDHVFDSEFEITPAQLEQAGILHLFVTKQIKVKDNDSRTAEIIQSVKVKKDANAGKTIEQLETGSEFK